MIERPVMLFILWAVPLAGAWFLYIVKRRERKLALFVAPPMQSRIVPATLLARARIQAVLVAAALFFMLAAVAGPKWGRHEEVAYEQGRDVVIALDVSRSMMSRDIRPDRLERAKADLFDLIDELHGDRAALLAFRRRAVLLCPLTTDYSFLKQALESVSIDSAPRGETDIGDAIIKALESFDEGEGQHRAIILISDGEDLGGAALKAAGMAKERGIPVFAVGMGSRSGAKVPGDDRQDYIMHEGSEVVSRLDADTLGKIADMTGGAYIPIGTSGMASITLGTIYRDYLRRVSAREFAERLESRYVERYQYFLLPGVLLLLSAAFLSRGRLSARPVSMAVMAAWIMLVPMPVRCESEPSGAGDTAPVADRMDTDVPPGRAGARKAQGLYLAGKYDEAADAYLKAMSGDTASAMDDYRLNAGICLYKAGRFREAADILGSVSGNRTGAGREALEGLGAALYELAALENKPDAGNLVKRSELLLEAAEAFRRFAALDLDNEAAAGNLGRVLGLLAGATEQARIAELIRKYQDTMGFDLLDSLLRKQRDIIKGLNGAVADTTPGRIAVMERLAADQEAARDLWIPLKGKIMNMLDGIQGQDTNSVRQAAIVEQMIERSRDSMRDAAGYLRDINVDRAGQACRFAENGTYLLWKGLAHYTSILEEDIMRQSNAILGAVSGEVAGSVLVEQSEALALSRLFKSRFGDMTRGMDAAGRTGNDHSEAGDADQQAGLTPELRQEIMSLADEAMVKQESAIAGLKSSEVADALADARDAHYLLQEIRKMLPSDDRKDSGQDKDNKSDDRQDQEEKGKDDQQPGDKAEDGQAGNMGNDAEKDDDQPPEEQSPGKKDDKGEKGDEEVQRMLERVLQREREYQAEKRERNRMMGLSPVERDW